MKSGVESTSRTRKQFEEWAKTVIEYYTATANYCKLSTARFFTTQNQKVTRKSIYRIIGRYEKRGTIKYVKRTGRKPTISTVENIHKLENLLKADPKITLTEAAAVLNLQRMTVWRMKRNILKKKPEVPSSAGGSVDGFWSEQCFFNEEDDTHRESESNDHSEDNEEVKPSPPTLSPSFNETPKVRRKVILVKKGEREGLRGPKRVCVACLKKIAKAPNGERKQGQLEANLNAVFILRMVFKLPAESIASVLGKFKGGELSKSVEFCEECQTLLEEAKEIHKQIQKLEGKLEKCRRNIEDIVIKNKLGHSNRKRRIPWETLMVCQMLREQVVSAARIHGNPFLEGDKLARDIYLVQNPLPPLSKVIIKEEIVEAQEPPEDIFEDSFNMGSEAEEESSQPPSTSSGVVKPDLGVVPESVEVPLNQSPPCNFSTPVSDLSMDYAITLETTVSPVFSPVPSTDIPQMDDKCDICGIGIRPFALPLHKLREHGVTMEGYTAKSCSEAGCNYATLYDPDFLSHVKGHQTNLPRPHTCQFCGKAFTNRQHLKIHEDIHKNAESRPYQCEICGSSFAVHTYLYLHKRLKHLNRPFPSTKRKKLNPKVT